MIFAVEAIGESSLGEARASIAAFTVGLLVTFLAVRINTRLIRAKVSWWFHDIESGGGVHVHHMVIGVVLMVTAGLVDMALLPTGLWQQLAAFAFGAGVALTLDEFALILRLQDVYWTQEGRLSVDAVIVAACAGLLFVLGYKPFIDSGDTGLTGDCGRRGGGCLPWGQHLLRPYLPGEGQALDRLLRPVHPLCRPCRRHSAPRGPPPPGRGGATRRSPRRMAKAQHREDRINATWRSWREAFFDLIAGKAHLPSVLAAGCAARTGAGRRQ